MYRLLFISFGVAVAENTDAERVHVRWEAFQQRLNSLGQKYESKMQAKDVFRYGQIFHRSFLLNLQRDHHDRQGNVANRGAKESKVAFQHLFGKAFQLIPDGTVLCPDYLDDPDSYCDGEGDCGAHGDTWCGCDEGQALCESYDGGDYGYYSYYDYSYYSGYSAYSPSSSSYGYGGFGSGYGYATDGYATHGQPMPPSDVPPQTCTEELCGGPHPFSGCWCDEMCCALGDCCADTQEGAQCGLAGCGPEASFLEKQMAAQKRKEAIKARQVVE